MDLSEKHAIGNALLVTIAVPNEPVTTFTTYWKSLTVAGVTYTGLGSLISISETQNNLRSTGQVLTLGISALPAENLALTKLTLLRGSPIEIRRYVFDPATGEALTGIGNNPGGRFFGIINNYTLDFDIDTTSVDRTATATVLLECSSTIDVLGNKVTGRRTTGEDMKKFFPGDVSMDRVGRLANSNFNFGSPT